MGLAASQARFLAITSRKMNCEFQSMQIAQDKLSVTRDLQSAATKYQNSMNATKLVWDTDTDEVYDLSYDLLMTPSALNDYNPYLITDSRGKIVLTDTMFNAAKNAGIIDENGDPVTGIDVFNKEYRDKFIDAMSSCGEIAPSTAQSVKDQAYTKAGMGGEILDKTIANALTTTGFISALKAEDDDGNLSYSVAAAFGINLADANVDTQMDNMFCYSTSPDVYTNDGNDTYDVGKLIISTNNGNALSREEIKNLSLGDLLSGKYSMTIVGGTLTDTTSTTGKYNEILKGLAQALGYQHNITSGSKGLAVDDESVEALDTAYEFTLADTQDVVETVSTGNDNSVIGSSISKSNDYNGIIDGTSKNGIQFQTISLTNLLKSYLTNFAIAIDGVSNTEFYVDKSSKESTYVTDDLNYYFLLEAEGSVTETDVLTADFYNQLYNQICLNGATTDSIMRERVSDPEHLMQALKNGQLFISSLNTDGYFYQGAYTLNGYVAEVTDEEAIAQAEMEYEITKTKLNYKEETLDLKMKNIDTELSALTTEYDTVKNLISKNVEKVFTMFST